MDADYQSLYKQVVALQYKCHDCMDQPNEPIAQSLRKEAEGIANDAKTKRNPRDIENKIRSIQHELQEARSQPNPVMSTQDLDQLRRTYEQVRVSLHDFQNY